MSAAFELAVAGGPAVIGFPAMDGVLVLLGCWWLYMLDCTMRHITRLSDYRPMAIGLLFFSAVGLSEYCRGSPRDDLRGLQICYAASLPYTLRSQVLHTHVF